jgi:hypothetical protein
MPGLNSEVVFNQETYHVQTQDKGPGANYVETIVYKSGRVLTSRRAYYTAHLSSRDLPAEIAALIEKEHAAVSREIEQGKFAKR